MIDTIYSLLSTLFGLTLLNGVLVFSAHNGHRESKDFSIDVRYVGTASIVFLVLLNGNQWATGKLFFPLLTLGSIAFIGFALRRASGKIDRAIWEDGISLLAVQIITLLWVFTAFQMHSYWLLESHNHDSMVYYQGLHWANDSRLFVGSEAVRARWDLGVCGEGAGWIGLDCPLYRGGTYTLVAWAQHFAPRITANGVFLIAAYSATMAWVAVRILTVSIGGLRAALIRIPFALAVALSTGTIGALVNSNLATVMASVSLALVVALALRTDLRPTIRYVLMAAWCAIGAHLYAESVFYAGLLLALVFAIELPKNIRILKASGVVRLTIIVFATILALGNIPLLQAFSSLLHFRKMAAGGEWFAWYIHAEPMLWAGSFIAGLLMASAVETWIVIMSSLLTLVAAVVLSRFRETRGAVLSLVGVSLLAVLYIESTGYQYGEHKIVHLLGPAWSLLVATSLFKLITFKDAGFSRKLPALCLKVTGYSGLMFLVIVLMIFLSKSTAQLNSLSGPHGLGFRFAELSSYINPGEKILLDDNAWIGVEKFHKSHYVIFQAHNEGGGVLMPSADSDPLRGGYFRKSVKNKFFNSDRVDWVVQARGYALPNSKFIVPESSLVWENADYRLFRAKDMPLAVHGNGWHDCEPKHCWTSAPFEMEVLAPSAGSFEMVIDFFAFAPPKDGVVSVHANDGTLIAVADALASQLSFELRQGWSRLTFQSSWSVSSPKEVGLSEDDRKLFVGIKKIEIRPLKMAKVE